MPNGKTIFGHCVGLITLQQRVCAEGGEQQKFIATTVFSETRLEQQLKCATKCQINDDQNRQRNPRDSF